MEHRLIARVGLAGAFGGLCAFVFARIFVEPVIGRAVAFVMAQGRVGSIRPRTTAMLIAAAGFAAVYVVPLVKYPPNPPAVGRAETIRERTGLYLLMVGLSIVLAIGSVWLGRRLTGRLGSWNATLVGAGAYLGGIAV